MSDPDTSEDPQALIDAMADQHGVDMDRAVTAVDPDPESSRIYVLEEVDRGYRLIGFGLDSQNTPAREKPMFIPDSAVGALQALLHSAGLHLAHRDLVADDPMGQDLNLRDVSEGMGVSAPMEPEGDQ